MSCFFTLLIISFSLYSYAEESCSKYLVAEFHYQNKAELKKAINSITSKKSIDANVETIDKIFEDTINNYYNKIESVILDQLSLEEEMKAMQTYIKNSIYPINDDLIKKIASLLDQKNIPYQIIKEKNKEYSILEVILNDQNIANEYLQKAAKKAEIKSIRYDFVASVKGNFLGSYNKNKDLDIGYHGIASLIRGQSIGVVINHELTHAIFERLRTLGKSSIFHGSFYGSKAKPLGLSGYRSFMSLEEIYTFTREPIWEAHNFLTPRKKDIDQVQKSFINIAGSLDDATQISSQSYNLSSDFIFRIDEIIRTAKLGEVSYLSKGERKTQPNKAYYAAIKDNYGRKYLVFLDQNKQDTLSQEKLTKAAERRLLGSIRKDLAEINKISEKLYQITKEYAYEINYQLGLFETELLQKGPSFIETPEWQNKFKLLRKDLRFIAKEVKY